MFQLFAERRIPQPERLLLFLKTIRTVAAFQAAAFLENNHMHQRHPVQNDVTMFVTTNTQHRRKVFRNPAYAREAVEYLYRIQERQHFLLFGFVIMPDHVHLLLQVRSPSTISGLLNIYKTGLTFQLGIGAFWQPRFDLRIPGNVAAVLRYIHQNPVKAGLAATSEDYAWSSGSGKWDISPIG